MKNLVLIPVIDRITADKCIESILMLNSAAEINPEDIRIVDNTKEGLGHYYDLNVYRDPENHNLGVPRAWNIGVREILQKGSEYDYVTLMSASMLFGPIKETTWTRQMRTFEGANCIESEGHSWHLIAFHKRIFERIGLFDENFYPGYFEAIDFAYRLKMCNLEGGWPHIWVNALSQDVGRHSDLVLAPPLLEYYRQKWGGDKGEEQFVLPFQDKPLGYFEDHSIPELALKYGLKNWW